MKIGKQVLHLVLASLFAAPLVCGAQNADEESTGEITDESSYDGLVPVKRAGFANVWVKPGVDISTYSKILPGPAQFHYRAVRDVGGSTLARSRATEFPIAEKDRAVLEEIMEEAFAKELTETKNFTVVEEPGPDVLFIWGGLHDVVSNAPPDLPGPGEVYLSNVGVATLVLQIEDSTSREVLARVVDRRAARTSNSSSIDLTFAMPSNAATNTQAVRRLAQSWARSLRDGLDRWHESGGTQ